MLRLYGIRHDVFPTVEPLNPRFVPGAPKIRITIETELHPRVPEAELLARLLAGFPSLARHECRVRGSRRLRTVPGARILLVDDDPSANQAHLLEHVVIDLLALFEPRVVRSGVTCAWQSPPDRNDVFIECADPHVGAAAAAIGVMALDAALSGRPLAPLYPDVARVWAVFAREQGAPPDPRRVERDSGLERPRVERALEVLARSSLLRRELYSLDLSDEPRWH